MRSTLALSPPRSAALSSRRGAWRRTHCALPTSSRVNLLPFEAGRKELHGLAIRIRTSTPTRFAAMDGGRSPRTRASLEGDPIKEWILSEGGATEILRISPVSGGCINSAYRYVTDNGSFFVKSNRNSDISMFEGERHGLEDMSKTNTIRVPKPFKVGSLPSRGSFIIMEYIEFGASRGQSLLGRQLAEMHKKGTSELGFGFYVDNTIGSTPQKNTWCKDWVTFFRDYRIGFQLSLIKKEYNDSELYTKGQKLLDKIPQFFEGLDITPSLLHGDLWSGNICSDKEGNPVILDPATYYGHSEAEFGMSWCAGFNRSFYDAYFEVLPKQPGFEDRAELYMLYHYLNHYNLFGSGYRGSCMSIINKFL